ncbi:MAG: phosphoribosylamine--glycine ligase [Candidatus Omnitrophota bacterium]|nr:MAG: phosphoribosylamine--glycine ligase [Candidatus Omnitrophota bacterium]RKY46567.1 MAG: phosphoribosylamine--glycine ligase [Candidatus Omnitrophota bacterium]HDN86507.1 phosphoribosylamine--glycine ligase [Candidatus Omnitrophota bacterium]
MKVLVIGGGGREHCLVYKIKNSSYVDKVFCASGNGGTALLAENVDIQPQDIEGIAKFALREGIDLTVVGPEAPLVEGIVDEFTKRGLKIFGPTKDVAILEGSKVFAKQFMRKYGIPTAEFEIFDDSGKAFSYIERCDFPCVVKADGLAGGKGAIICHNLSQAREAIERIMVKKEFGAAGEKVVVEDFLEGEEASLLAFLDTDTFLPLVTSQDHKPVFDNDQGPNTGGMGAYAPAPLIGDLLFSKIEDKILSPLVKGLKKENKVYKGIIYLGLMIANGEPYVLEFNVRFGDPETQAILPKLKSDLVEVILANIEGRLKNINLVWDQRFCICVVLASGGYPGKYEKGKVINGLESLEKQEDILVFHAGTKKVFDSQTGNTFFVTNGGRVLNIVGLDSDFRKAQEKVYSAIKKVYFEGMHYRRDIGNKGLKFLS